ncbi:MAG TPA: sugar diacid recognition domain-containing protein [Anaeromyxobacteraceae bacterium]|nr:sugar diacid recognition domain-containing protein [Anaeromyxobacteraceae bacterium]
MPFDKAFLPTAERFVRFIEEETGHPVIICDETGTIIRATVRSRIGTSHAGAKRILRGEADEAAVTAEEAAANPLVKEGYNCPIAVDRARVGTFGIGGPIEEVRPIARIASAVLAAWVKETRQQGLLHQASRQVALGTKTLSERILAAQATGAKAVEALIAAADDAVARVNEAASVVLTVQEIAQQSRILSINGAIQATRAGDYGKPFAVVARDVTKLADQTGATAKDIEKRLAGVRAAIGQVREAASIASSAGKAQAASLQEMRELVSSLQGAVSGLERSFGDSG